jgi:hypothetical protein
MGACSSKDGGEASATVHAAGPDTPARAAPAPGLKRTAAPAGPPTARLAKRGAVGEAEHVSEAEDTLASLPKVAKSSTEAALIAAAIADNILFKVRAARAREFKLCTTT